MLVRLINMRGVDLRVFDFDYDLTWAGFFMNADQEIYGRFGGRGEGDAETYLTLPGLKYAMRQALDAHRAKRVQPRSPPKPVVSVDQFPAAARVTGECIHCHQVYDFSRESLRGEKKWKLDDVWTYPPPKNLGLVLDPKQGNHVLKVTRNSPADAAGLRKNDVLRSVGDWRVASYGDIQYALHYASEGSPISVTIERDGRSMPATIKPREGWRESDPTWRGSMWALAPPAAVYGKDLEPAEKKDLGLTKKRLAFYQGDFVPAPSRKAGIQARDIIIGIDGKELEMTMLQFNVHVRLNFKVGDKITYNVIRDGKRLEIPMVLEERE